MIHSLKERFWMHIRAILPERQIYIRTNGRVHFFTISPLFQVSLACVAAGFLGWVAFTSVNVIFKDRILSAKEHRFEQLQASYEARIADLQLSYDELNGTVLRTEDRFKAMADAFEAKQKLLAEIIGHKQKLEAIVASRKPATAPNVLPSLAATGGKGGALEPLFSNDASLAPGSAADLGSIDRTAPETPVAPAQESDSAAPADGTTFFKDAVQKFGSLFRRKISETGSEHRILAGTEVQARRIAQLEAETPALLGAAHRDVENDVTRLNTELRRTGIDSKKLIARVASGAAAGRPFVVAGATELGMDDPDLGSEILSTMGAMDQLGQVVAAFKAIPLIVPVDGAGVSSGFGARIDPFNESLAFHSGIDFSAPKGSDIHVTAPGVVIFAGRKGAYGNSIEIDHGYGIRTRYGHLAKILVRPGERLETGAVIGRVGSTGRSTGPHVHYEVWFDDAVRDPAKFIKVGQHVLEN